MDGIKIIIDLAACTGCGECALDCPRRVIKMTDGRAEVVSEECLKCGHCLAICPVSAVRMDGLEDEILEAVEGQAMLGAEELKRHLKLRRSVRRYKQVPVERDKIEQIIEAGRLTPSGSNMQNVRYIVIQRGLDELEDEATEIYRAVSKMTGMPLGIDISKYKLERGFLFHGATAVILVVSENNTNACLAAMSMELMAEALGLGTLYVGLFARPANHDKELRRKLGLEDKENIAVCLALGYPDVTYSRSAPKKPAAVEWR